MTVTTTNTKNYYDGTGSIFAFATTFQFLDETDLTVTLRNKTTGVETAQVLNSDYTVSGGDGSTGTVTFSVAPTSAYRVVIRRTSARTQTTDFVENDAFPAESHERALDRITMQEQETLSETEDAIRAPQTDETADLVLPNATLRASKILGFAADGNTVQMYDPATPIPGDASADTVTSTSGTTARTLANRTDDVGNVKDFGAVGDGVADDTAAIAACLTAHSQAFFPDGTYLISSTITMIGGRIFSEGHILSLPSIEADAGMTGTALNVLGGSVEGISFSRDAATAMTSHFVMMSGERCRMRDCIFVDVADATTPASFAALRVSGANTISAALDRIQFIDCGVGLSVGNAQSLSASNLFFNGFDWSCVHVDDAASSGIDINSVYCIQKATANADGHEAPIYIEDGDGIYLSNLYLRDVYRNTFTANSNHGLRAGSAATNVAIDGYTLDNDSALGTMWAAVQAEGDAVRVNNLILANTTNILHGVRFSGATPRVAEVDSITVGSSAVLFYSKVHDDTTSAGLTYFPAALNALQSTSFQVAQEYGTASRAAANGEWYRDLWEQIITAGAGANPTVSLASSTSTVPHAWVPGSAEIVISALGTADLARVWKLRHYIPDEDAFKGRSLTFSVALRASVAMTIPGGRIEAGHTGTATVADTDIISLDTNWREYSVTYDVPTNAVDLFVQLALDHDANDQQISTTGTIWMAMPQVSFGSNQRQYVPQAYDDELADVRRIYEAVSLGAGERLRSNGVSTGVNTAEFLLHYRQKVAAPTITVSNATDFDVEPSSTAASSIVFSEVDRDSALMTVTATGGFTAAAEGVILVDDGAGNAQIRIDARS